MALVVHFVGLRTLTSERESEQETHTHTEAPHSKVKRGSEAAEARTSCYAGRQPPAPLMTRAEQIRPQRNSAPPVIDDCLLARAPTNSSPLSVGPGSGRATLGGGVSAPLNPSPTGTMARTKRISAGSSGGADGWRERGRCQCLQPASAGAGLTEVNRSFIHDALFPSHWLA